MLAKLGEHLLDLGISLRMLEFEKSLVGGVVRTDDAVAAQNLAEERHPIWILAEQLLRGLLYLRFRVLLSLPGFGGILGFHQLQLLDLPGKCLRTVDLRGDDLVK
ncbi:MAG: hypothetical protein HUU20_16615 [Pirellulales bacterium]|nr:hypothetical protein [Pirellulales bacterium]